MRIGVTEPELQDVWESVRLLIKDGWEAVPVDVAELPERLRGAYLGGSFHPMDGEMQPVHFVRGLVRLAMASGAAIYEASPVVTLTEHADHVLARTPEGAVRARTAVLATNLPLPALLEQVGAPWLGRVVTPARGQMLATVPVEEELFSWPCYADEAYHYCRHLRNSPVLVPGWPTPS